MPYDGRIIGLQPADILYLPSLSSHFETSIASLSSHFVVATTLHSQSIQTYLLDEQGRGL